MRFRFCLLNSKLRCLNFRTCCGLVLASFFPTLLLATVDVCTRSPDVVSEITKILGKTCDKIGSSDLAGISSLTFKSRELTTADFDGLSPIFLTIDAPLSGVDLDTALRGMSKLNSLAFFTDEFDGKHQRFPDLPFLSSVSMTARSVHLDGNVFGRIRYIRNLNFYSFPAERLDIILEDRPFSQLRGLESIVFNGNLTDVNNLRSHLEFRETRRT